MILSPHEIAWLVQQRWRNLARARVMVAICLAESDGDADVIARSTEGENIGQRDHGLAQVSGRWQGDKLRADPDWRDPATNLDIARLIFGEAEAAGKDPFSPWAVYNSGAYKKYLPDADFGLAFPFPPPSKPATESELDDINGMVAALSEQVAALMAAVAEIRQHFA